MFRSSCWLSRRTSEIHGSAHQAWEPGGVVPIVGSFNRLHCRIGISPMAMPCPTHSCQLFRHLRYYQAVRNERAGNPELESEALLSSAEMTLVRYDYEIADGYIARFFGKFKHFKTIINRHPRIFFRRLQRMRNRHFRELVEFEFGIRIPPKPLSRVQRLENNRLSDSDPDNDKDSELPRADSELENNRLSDNDPDNDTDSELPHTDSELDDGLLSSVAKNSSPAERMLDPAGVLVGCFGISSACEMSTAGGSHCDSPVIEL